MKAYSLLPDRFEDGRNRALEHGLQAVGFEVIGGYGNPEPGDVLITWTRHHGGKEQQCERFEARGGRVIVAEEPHLKGIPPGLGARLYSLMWHDHQVGPWYVGGPERWASFGIELKPWRYGNEVVVREQRGIGSARMRSPDAWHHTVMHLLRNITQRPVRLRRHPKILAREGAPAVSLAEDLRDARCLVTWASSDGTEALVLGVPVVACAPDFLAAGTVGRHLLDIESAPSSTPERQRAFERLAWSQWTLEEIRSGLAFDYLMRI